MKLRTKSTILKIKVGGITVDYKQLTPRELDDITKKHTTYEGAGVEMRRVVDSVSISEDMFVQSIAGWKGATDEDTGDSLPCTEETRRGVFSHDQQFVAHVTTKVKAENKRRQERAAKN